MYRGVAFWPQCVACSLRRRHSHCCSHRRVFAFSTTDDDNIHGHPPTSQGRVARSATMSHRLVSAYLVPRPLFARASALCVWHVAGWSVDPRRLVSTFRFRHHPIRPHHREDHYSVRATDACLPRRCMVSRCCRRAVSSGSDEARSERALLQQERLSVDSSIGGDLYFFGVRSVRCMASLRDG